MWFVLVIEHRSEDELLLPATHMYVRFGFRVNIRWDQTLLEVLNHFCKCHRTNEFTPLYESTRFTTILRSPPVHIVKAFIDKLAAVE